MLLVDFPINGPLRIPLLTIEWIFIIICVQLSCIFLFRYFKREKELRNLQELGYFSLLMGFSVMWFFYIISDYYASDEIVSPFLGFWAVGSERYLYLNLGYFTIMVGALFFLYFIEKYKFVFIKRYLFTILFLIYAILFILLFLIDIRIPQNITYMFWPLFILFFFLYLVDFGRRVKNRKTLFYGVLKLFPGIVLLLVGFLFTTDALINVFGLEIRLFGAVFQLIGIVLLSIFFMSLPPFSEFDWQDKLESLYIINMAGIGLYFKDFKKRGAKLDQNLISSALSSINIVLKGLTKESKGFSVIKKKRNIILIYQGKYVFGVLICNEELNIAKLVLKDLIEKFETIYANILVDWDGELSVFSPTENIVREIFSMK
ncbi:MAG: hypothetical protein GF353_22750 [Candidatus Lokiarchaeota archaeon]|nr:hypothetical protein [Candidatus Lokiarchaeota archaeon]